MAIAVIAILSSASSYFGSRGASDQTITEDSEKISDLIMRVNRIDYSLQQLQASNSGQTKNNCQLFARVETQFGTVETVMNQLRVDEIRERGLVWPKLFRQPYPSVFYEIEIPHEISPC